MGLRIGLRLFLARVRGVVGADAVDDTLRDPVPEAFAMGGVADGRIELSERAEPLVAFGRSEREMGGRGLRRGDVLVPATEDGLVLGGDVQHVHAFCLLYTSPSP